MVRVEGVYRDLSKVGQELLCNSINLPPEHRGKLFQAVDEDFDLECFFSHLNHVRKNDLQGYTFINIKPQTFIHYHEDILGEIDRKIVIELREDWMTQAQMKKLCEIRESFPFLLSIDDFGTGSSNLDRVKALHPNFIKLDMEVFRKNGRLSLKELTTFVSFLKEYTNAVLIAEKVETEIEWRIARASGIHLWSGFYERNLNRRRY